jgi:hypothetical protein
MTPHTKHSLNDIQQAAVHSPGTEFLLRVIEAMSRIFSARAPSIP